MTKTLDHEAGFRFDSVRHVYTLDGKRMYGVTQVLGVISKPALIQWAANMACDYIWENAAKLEVDAEDKTKAFLLEKYAHEMYRFVTKNTLEEARKAHAKKRDTAAESGTDVHAEIEIFVRTCIKTNNGYPDINIPVLKVAQTFVAWAISENIRFLSTEKRLYSKELWVAGTCDLVFEKDGKTYIGDIKTYKKLWDRVPMLQCAGYGLMWEEMHDVVPMGDDEAKDPNAIAGYCVIRIKDGFEVKWSYDVEGDREAFIAAVKLFKALQNWQ